MDPHELFAAGRLSDAVAAQAAEVRANPGDLDARVNYMFLMCFAGELDRAASALTLLQQQDEVIARNGAIYMGLLAAEAQRRAVWNVSGEPLLPPDAPEHLEIRVKALEAHRSGDAEQCAKLVDEAAEAAPESAGRLNDAPFDAIRDYDDLLGPALEIFAGGTYVWMPFERIRKLTTEAPKNDIDLLWLAAELDTHDGNTASVHLPCLYDGSHAHADENVRVGRTTEWLEAGPALYRGAGQHTLLSISGEDETETGIVSVRSLELDAPG